MLTEMLDVTDRSPRLVVRVTWRCVTLHDVSCVGDDSTVELRDTSNVTEDAAEVVVEYEMVCVSSSGQSIQGSLRDRG